MSATPSHRRCDCALRPLAEADRVRLLAWRNQDHIRRNMYTHHRISRDEHDRWFDRALEAVTARYLIFELRARPVGFVSFTGIDHTHGRCNWAFYLGEADVPRGTGAAMEYLALDHAFDTVGVDKLCCEVLGFNAGVVRLHQRFGFHQEGLLERHHRRDGEAHDVVLLARFADGWRADRAAIAETLFAPETPDAD